ncbi:MAG: RlmE family RNA methyltransferase [Myxococcales bacterium FL481]|nr:MAG: RlmE family RNA methyltransferase [Myxococcales bacterium FL481]
MVRKHPLSDRRARHDPAYLRAKAENYAGRAIYKLQEIDRKFRLIRHRGRVLDLGCWPGSWLQYVGERIGDEGFALGIDLDEVEIGLPSNIETRVGDVEKLNCDVLVERYGVFDVVLSDMAPNTTGIREADQWRSEELFLVALKVALAVLRPGGHFAAKVFQGGRFPDLLRAVRAGFEECKPFRPDGTRPGSLEQYVVGKSRRRS